MPETIQQELARLGVRPTIYYRRRRQGMSHEDAIEAALNAPTAARRLGNTIDHSAAGASELLRMWKRA